MKRNAKIRVKEGSGNVFADLGFANPEREELTKPASPYKFIASSKPAASPRPKPERFWVSSSRMSRASRAANLGPSLLNA